MAAIGTSAVGKPISLNDNVTVSAKVVSISGTFVTLLLANSGGTIQVDVRDLNGAQQSNGPINQNVQLFNPPTIGAQVTFNAQVNSASGAGATAVLTVQLRFPTQLVTTSSPPIPITTVIVNAFDVVNSMTL